MLSSPRARTLSLGVLFVVLFGLLVWYGTLTPAPALGDYPNEHDVLSDTDHWLGHEASITGQVVETEPLTVRVTSGDTSRRITVTGVDIAGERGDKLRAFGTLTGPTTLDAENAFTVPTSGLLYTYLISFVAGLWVLARLIRHSGFDRETIGLVIAADGREDVDA